MKDLLLIQSLDLGNLIEDYRLFFLTLLPSVFIVAVIVEFLANQEPFALAKRAFISILLLVSVTSFYQQSIDYSMELADKMLERQKQGNLLLMDMLDGAFYVDYLEQSRKEAENSTFDKVFSFFKYHLFEARINRLFTIVVYFIVALCLFVLKVVYSLVYYMGYGLFGIPCLLYLFPNMGRVLYGGIISYLWCLTVPHVLVFVLAMIGSEINRGYSNGEIIGGSIMGTVFLFVMALAVAFVPLMTSALLNRSGMAQVGGIVAAVGANYMLSPMRNIATKALKVLASMIFPKMFLASIAKSVQGAGRSGRQGKGKGGPSFRREQGQSERSKEAAKTGPGQIFPRGEQNKKQTTQSNTQNQSTQAKNNKTLNSPINSKKIQTGQAGHIQRPQTQKPGEKHGTLPKHRPRHQRPEKPAPNHHRRGNLRPPDGIGGRNLRPPTRKK